VDAPEALELADLRAMGERLRAEPVEVQQFVTTALGHIERLTGVIQGLRQAVAAASDDTADETRRQRLDDLVLEQAATIELQQDTIARIRALCDLAAWSADTTGEHRDDATVRVDDLSRVLGSSDQGGFAP
jgi:hypothetical protein